MSPLRRVLLALAMLAGTLGPAVAQEVFTARGQEPPWHLRVEGGALRFTMPGTDVQFEAPSVTTAVVDGHPRLTARQGGEELVATVLQRLCADAMTGMPFPVGVEVAFAGRRLAGCGGEILTAIEGGWRVVRLGDGALPQGVIATVFFGDGGKISGRSGCNRFNGAYVLSAEGLTFGDLAATRMACGSDAARVERQFLKLMSQITRATPGDNAQLRLMAGDRQAMVLDRVD